MRGGESSQPHARRARSETTLRCPVVGTQKVNYSDSLRDRQYICQFGRTTQHLEWWV